MAHETTQRVYEFSWRDRIDTGRIIVVATSEEAAREAIQAHGDSHEIELWDTYDLGIPVYVITDPCDD